MKSLWINVQIFKGQLKRFENEAGNKYINKRVIIVKYLMTIKNIILLLNLRKIFHFITYLLTPLIDY